MQDYALTKNRIFQWLGIILAAAVIAVGYWYWRADAGVTTNKTLNDPMSHGLAGYWKLDDGSGTSATDSSPNAATSTLTNGPTWTTGQIGGAVDFDGSNDHILVTSGAATQIRNSLSLSGWVKLDTIPGNGVERALFSHAGSGGHIYYFRITGVSSNQYLQFTPGSGGNNNTSSQFSLSTGTWYHFAVTYDVNSDRVSFYKDGSLLSQGTDAIIGGYLTPTTSLYLGSHLGASNYFDGQLDEMRIYNRDLSADEVGQLYRLTSPTGTDTSLKGYWTFDGKDVSGTTAYDRSGVGNTGTLVNGPSITPGKIGQALSFDGSDDDVTIADSASLSPTGAITISFWIKPTGLITGTTRSLIAKSVVSQRAWGISLNTAGQPRFYVASGSGDSGSNYGTANGALTRGEWNYITAVFDGSQSTNDTRARMYVNGVAQTLTFTGTIPASLVDSTAIIDIGDAAGAYGSRVTGLFDEVRIYDAPLSALQIESLYKAGQSDETNTGASQPQGGSRLDSGLAGYWAMDNGSGTSATDSSTNGNTGTLTNGPTWTTGQIGGAVTFDGNNDTINMASAPNLSSTGSFSYSIWVNPTTYTAGAATGGDGTYFFDRTTGTSSIVSLKAVSGSGTKWGYQSRNSSSGNIQTISSTTTIATSQWTHIVIVREYGVGYRIYVNGVQEGSSSTGASDTITAPTPSLGGSVANSSGYTTGSLDEFRIYNRALANDEISQLYRLSTPTGVDNGLKGYWSFNGKDVSGTTAYDRSGAGNTGTLTNSPTVTPGKIGQALRFDGSDDYVTIPDNSSLEPSTALTVSAWIKRGNTGTRQFFISKGGATGSSDNQYWLEITTANLIVFQIASNSTGYSITSPSALTDTGSWHLMTGTWDGTTQRLYIDGVQVASGAASLTLNNTNDNLALGNRSTFPNLPFNGLLDEPRIYSRALSADEIKALYKQGQSDEVNTGASQPQGTQGLIAHWRFDEGTGTSASDNSVSANNGTLTNGPTWTTGQFGGAVSLDGTDDYVVGSAFSSMDVPATLCGWYKISGSSDVFAGTADSDTIAMMRSSSANYEAWGIGIANTAISTARVTASAMDNANGTSSTAQGTTNLWSARGWIHVCGVFNSSTSRDVYLNGVYEGSNTSSENAQVTTLHVGTYTHSTTTLLNYAHGDVDDVRLYNRALRANEIAELASITPPTSGGDSSLKGYWSFNGKDVSGTTAYDRSGTGNTGTLSNGPTVTPGKLGQALNFESASSQSVSITSHTSLQSPVFTYTAWVNPATYAGEGAIFGTSSSGPRFAVGPGGDLRLTQTGVSVIATTADILPTNSWSHIAVTYDVSGNYIFYFNGANILSGTDLRSFAWSTMNIGQTSSNYFNGKIDEVRAYNRVLSASEITALYNQGR